MKIINQSTINIFTYNNIQISNMETAIELYDKLDEPKRGIMFTFKFMCIYLLFQI